MKRRPSGFVDNKLKQRVIQYLTSNRCGKYVDIGFLASDLQRMYSVDYGRRKKNAFRIQVEKVFSIISNEKGLKDLTEFKEENVAKRFRQGEEDNEYTESCSDDDSNMEDYPDSQSANHMNSSLLCLYRKGNPDSVSNTPDMDQRETNSPAPRLPSRTGSVPLKTSDSISEGGWFIDKTPGGKKNSFFLDLADEKSNHQKPASEIQDSKDSSLLESAKKQKGRLKSKGSKRKKEDLQELDAEIETVLQKKAKARGLELQISSVKFEDVGGNDMTLKEVCKMLIHMRHPEVYHHLGVIPPRGVLLHGPPGCGKTLLAHAIAGELDLPILKIAATEIVSGVSGESEQKLRELFEQAVSNAPCIFFIDEIDAITPKREVASKDMERRIVAQLLTCMDGQYEIINLNEMIFRGHNLDSRSTHCTSVILQTLCRKLRLPEAFNFHHLAHLTPGFVGADLMALCREAATCAVSRVLMKLEEQQKKDSETEDLPNAGGQQEWTVGNEHTSEKQGELQRLLGLLRDQDPLSEDLLQGLCIELNDFIVALASVQPSAKREGFVTVPNVTWADIGALEDIREELTMAILAPVRNPDQFKALGLMTPAGVLLAGPPGCGKTLLAKAVANESGLNFISVKGPELLNMYVGESERAVRQVFQRAKNSAPCVIFFDEVDALCPRRSDREAGASVRVVNQLLTEMDGLETRQQVFIMAATNRPDIIDPAILRPGRLDKTLFVGLPPPADRLAILKTITKNGTKPPLDADVNLDAIAGDLRCDCYTGADLSALVREASLCALRQEMARQKSGNEKGELKISLKHFEEAFKKVKPSISKKDQLMYDMLQRSLSG
ncbi:PREDICTED: nuclear valosin-containing protein-like [Chrysochloris asiatica]|uniref:Nuclear valosin-containing protein-like n=1 Tax=Chrysochloris asiatica TaxID=185453 RepID=A0A9B0U244_CHRAS|nr:PREDICTED: nuclear valosin-containing protein-like [Chrysochloris asiatica]